MEKIQNGKFAFPDETGRSWYYVCDECQHKLPGDYPADTLRRFASNGYTVVCECCGDDIVTYWDQDEDGASRLPWTIAR